MAKGGRNRVKREGNKFWHCRRGKISTSEGQEAKTLDKKDSATQCG
jgi:hypothetical protein